MAQDTLEHIAALIAQADHIVIMTGAGASKESGIPTFRDALDGLWSKYEPGELATPEAFEKNPALVTQWYDERRLSALQSKPNAGHIAMAKLQKRLESQGKKLTLITQNVDELHQRAGAKDVLELHGSLITWRGASTGEKQRNLPEDAFESYPPKHREGTPQEELLRPDVVWFGEGLPEDALQEATTQASQCNLYFSVGTSSVVWPAAGIVDLAIKAGATTVEVNPTETILSSEYDHVLRGPSGEIFPKLLELAFPD